MPKRQKGKKRKKTKEPREPQDLKRIKRYGDFTTPISKDVLLLVFQYFNMVDLANARLVCRDFDRTFVSHKETILHSVYCNTYGIPKLETARSASWSQICAVRTEMDSPTEEDVKQLLELGLKDNRKNVDRLFSVMREFKCRIAVRNEMKKHKIPKWMILGTCFSPESEAKETDHMKHITQEGHIHWTLFAPSGKMIKFSFELEITIIHFQSTEQEVNIFFETTGKKSRDLVQIHDAKDERKITRQYFDELIAEIGIEVPPETIREYITICSHFRYPVEIGWSMEQYISTEGWPDFYYSTNEKKKKIIYSSSESEEEENSDDE
eukprot:TRINITY_DN1198_c0_g1_i5.p1 TRINITY_DN1198_c0_g1~~TRINITY_DN1198_c0_g1_i5.p1  ORF type:complete len:323 (+),score=70.32 TRINITY_DN1198_c0_g1_i5:44-1012(+)